jgi:hypothetical protein
MQIFYGEKNAEGTMNWTKPANERWKFKGFVLTVYADVLDFSCESYKDGEINVRPYDINDAVRNQITVQILNAKLSDFYEPDCGFYSSPSVYLFKTNNCDMIVYGEALRPDHSSLNIDEINFLRKQIDSVRRTRWTYQPANPVTSELISNTALKKFGWINCDRFISDTVTKNFIVRLKSEKDEQIGDCSVFMVFKNINSILNGNGNKSKLKYSFRNVPVNAEVTLIAISKSKDKILAGKSSSFKLSDCNSFDIKLEEITADKLEPLINSL